jgi:MFS family permease
MRKPPSQFRDSDFIKFWIGQSISVFGAQFSPLAIGTIAVLTLRASPLQMGLLAFLNTIPFLTLGLFAGVWADRHRRRRIMIIADFGRSLTLFTIPVAAVFYVMTMNLLYLVTLVAGIFTVFFEIAYQSYLPRLVQKSLLVQANSRLEATKSISQVAGPTADGFAIALISAPLAVLGDTFGYLASSFSLLLIRKPEEVEGAGERRSIWRDIREGLAVVFGDKRLRAIAGATATFNFFGNAFGAIQLKYYYDHLQMTSPQVGLSFGIGSIGGVIGALVANRVTRVLGMGRTIILSAALGGVSMVSVYFATPSDAFLVATIAAFITTFFVLLYNIPQVSFRQALVPIEIQGRMNATIRTIVWGVMPLGGLMGGIVAEFIGVHLTFGLMTVLGTLPFL